MRLQNFTFPLKTELISASIQQATNSREGGYSRKFYMGKERRGERRGGGGGGLRPVVQILTNIHCSIPFLD